MDKTSPSEPHRGRGRPEVVMEAKESYMPFGNIKGLKKNFKLTFFLMIYVILFLNAFFL